MASDQPSSDQPSSDHPSKGEATRARILARAISRFADEGFRQTSVAAIARDAGVTSPTVHAYFGSKDDLFRAAFAQDVTRLLEQFTDGGLLSAPYDLVPRLLSLMDDHPLVRRIFRGLEAERTPELLDLPAVAAARQQLIGTVAAGQQAGLLRPDLAATDLAGALETLILALLLGAVQVGMIGGESRRAAIVAVISAGLRTPVA